MEKGVGCAIPRDWSGTRFFYLFIYFFLNANDKSKLEKIILEETTSYLIEKLSAIPLLYFN